MRRLLLSLGLALTFSLAYAQNANFPILLKSGTILPSEQVSQDPQVYQNQRYVLIQHPKLKVQNGFYGFEVLDYLPKHSGFARVSTSQFAAAKSQLEAAGGTVLDLNPTWKLSKPLATQNYPEWAWTEDEQLLSVWVKYWPGLSALNIHNALSAQGYTIEEMVDDERRIRIAIDPEKLNELTGLAFVKFVEEKFAPGEPENFTARTNHRITAIQQGHNGGIHYDGTGIMVAHNDAGAIIPHIDFKGRFTQNAGGGAGSDHGDHTAGTINGAGNRDPEGVGMAPGADMFYRLYPANLNDADNIYTSINARLTSNSFSNGCNGGYSSWAQQLDKDAFDNPFMLHVFSAGNNGSSSCSNNYGAGIGWGNITGGHKQGKNVVTVGNVTRNDALAPSSSRGPATDGRIKPDIVAVGTNVYSTTDANGPNTYNSKTGTSMSCPGVTGSLAVLMEAYKDLNGGAEAHGTFLKGTIMNTADDLGNPGPDYRFGYGRINVRKAYEVLESGTYANSNVADGDSVMMNFAVPANTTKLKLMLIWTDPEGSVNSARNLVNDLDLTASIDGNTFQPWVLDPTPNSANLNSNAVRGRDSLNNVEQITIDNPSGDTLSVMVKGFDVPVGANQEFYVIAYYEKDELIINYPTAGTAFSTGSNQLIRFDAPDNSGTNVAEFSTDGGQSWLPINSTANSRTISWVIPNIANDQVYLRMHNNTDTAVVGPMTIVQVPAALAIESSCPDSVTISWNGVPGASGYVLYQLGAKYMDSTLYTTNTSATVPHDPLVVDWFSVAAVVNDSSVGFRAVAIEKTPGVFNCQVANDLTLMEVLSPGFGDIPECASTPASDRVGLVVMNSGAQPISNFDLGFQRVGAPSASVEQVSRTVNPGDTIHYYFQNSQASLITNITLTYQYWVDANDGNPFNDSLQFAIRKVRNNHPVETLPFAEDFETFSTCSDDANCGVTTCNLINGWINAQNFGTDEIDFRVDRGGTFSSGTGPNFDHTPGTTSGNYLYLESSGGCDSAMALLLTPCINLDSAFAPEAVMQYHMRGDAMGTLSADIYDGERWHLDVVNKIIGDQGGGWQALTIDLSPFIGKTIAIRYRGKTGDDFTSDLALDAFNIYDNSGFSVSENDWNSGLRVFPNPGNGLVKLESAHTLGAQTEIQLLDLSGKTLWSKPFEANAGNQTMEIDLRSLAKGVYFIQVNDEGRKHQLRYIKK